MSQEPFILFPAIDILDGQCVRLFQGDYDKQTAYSKDPVAVAEQWCQAGATYLHVVDLDGAKQGRPVNEALIQSIVKRAAEFGAKVEVGGGIRNQDAIDRWLSSGVERVVIGSASKRVDDMGTFVQKFGSERIVAGLDGRDGKLAVDGWIEQTEILLTDLARDLAAVGVRFALVTDVDRDGTLEGANLSLAKAITDCNLQAIASGGIRDEADILAACDAGLYGAVVGKSLYDGRIALTQTLASLAERRR